MRIIFFGTPEFSVPSLQQVMEASHEVAAVVTQPDRPKGRAKEPVHPAVKEAALAAGLQVLQPEKPQDENFLQSIRALRPECAVVVAYGRILPPALLSLFQKGAVNLHPSLLPKFRGAAPIQWTLIRGEQETGVTIFRLDDQLDHGPILLQMHHKIDPQDNAETLSDLLSTVGARALVDALELLENGRAHLHPQNDEAATAAPPLRKKDGIIRWEEDCTAVHNRVRGVQPWPGALTESEGKLLKLLETFPDDSRNAAGEKPGAIVSADEVHGLWVQTGSGQLRIDRLQMEGGKALDTGSFLRGHRLSAGTSFTRPKQSL